MARTFFDRKRLGPKGQGDASAPCAARKLGHDDVENAAPERNAERDMEHGSPCQKEGTGRAAVAAQEKSGEEEAEGRTCRAANTQRPTGENSASGDGVERHASKIYDDTNVCQALGLRRRILVQKRTAASRGRDWGCVGEHAGMTEGWIRRWNAKADIGRMKPIELGDGITTVKVVGHVTNSGVILAAKVSDGTRVMVRVLDARYLHRGDEMDCRTLGGLLTYAPELNRERY